MNTLESRRKATGEMLSAVIANRHHALMAWAHHNNQHWVKYQCTQEHDSHDWHVAEVEKHYWKAVLDLLKERMQ